MPIDYSRYPGNWDELRAAVLKRAGNRCEVCGLENGQEVWAVGVWTCKGRMRKIRSVWFRDSRDAERENLDGKMKIVKVVLTIAHLDHDENNMEVSIDRLRAMCQLCHLRYDAPEKARRKAKHQSDEIHKTY